MNQANRIQSIRQRLLNLSRERRIDYNLILIRYALERLLYRVGRSRYSQRYILKGAMLFSVWSRQPFRPTKDLDFLGYGDSSEESLKSAFREILQNESEEDGLVFEHDRIEVHPIREEQEYGGQRITLPARLGNARIRLQIDIGFGDAITPGPQKVLYPTLLEMPAPEILTYSKETVIAEKIHAIIVLGITNSRMKDYYDLWDLSRGYEFDGNLLTQAIQATFERRKTAVPDGLPPALTEVFYNDNAIVTGWNAFIEKTDLSVVEKNFETVVQQLQRFFGEILESLYIGRRVDKKWDKIGWRNPPE